MRCLKVKGNTLLKGVQRNCLLSAARLIVPDQGLVSNQSIQKLVEKKLYGKHLHTKETCRKNIVRQTLAHKM